MLQPSTEVRNRQPCGARSQGHPLTGCPKGRLLANLGSEIAGSCGKLVVVLIQCMVLDFLISLIRFDWF